MKNVTASAASYESGIYAFPSLALRLSCCCSPRALATRADRASPTHAWIALGPEGGDVRSLAHDPHDPSRIFLGTSAGELYLSTRRRRQLDPLRPPRRRQRLRARPHRGRSRRLQDDLRCRLEHREQRRRHFPLPRRRPHAGSRFPAMHGKSVRSFAVFARDSRTMVAGALDGVFRSTDAGDTWQRISPAESCRDQEHRIHRHRSALARCHLRRHLAPAVENASMADAPGPR